MSKQFEFFLDPKACQIIEDPKEYFFNMVSACLLQETKYYSSSDATRDELVRIMKEIAVIDPEFVMQTAFYVRNKMYIRTCTNFIVAFAILQPQCSPFVPKYFNETVLIPGDLLEVCQFVQIISLILKGQEIGGLQDLRKKLHFPKLLQHCVASKIKEFTVYQLGKQCSDSNRKKILTSYKEFFHPELEAKRLAKKKAKIEALKALVQGNQDIKEVIDSKVFAKTGKARKNEKSHKYKAQLHQEITAKNIFDIKFVTMKDVIRFCHVTSPKELVMSIMGKKYPKTEEEFNESFHLEKLKNPNLQFNQSKAGQRLQVPIPVTWERELSSKGKGAGVWENLIKNNQIPYMANMRNLRNILKSGVPDECHKLVIDKIENPKQVENAKMFPLQYFNAISEIDKLIRNVQGDKEDVKQFGRRGGRGGRTKPVKEKSKMEIELEEAELAKVNVSIVGDYKIAVEKAIKISVDKNLANIPGTTYVFCDVSGSMGAQISGGKKYGSVSQCQDIGFLLGLMIKSKCQNCEFYLFSNPQGIHKVPYCKIDVDTENLLQGMKRCQEVSATMGKGSEMIGQSILDTLLRPKVKADNVIVLSDMMVTQGFSEGGQKFETVIKDYVREVNPFVKFFFMDISGQGKQVTFGKELKSKNCFTITGMNDNVLKFISLAGLKSQVEDVKDFSKEAKVLSEQKAKRLQDQCNKLSNQKKEQIEEEIKPDEQKQQIEEEQKK